MAWVRALLVAEAVALAMLVSLLAARALAGEWRLRRVEPAVEACRRALARALVSGCPAPDLASAGRLGRRRWEEAILTLARQLSGRSSAPLREKARALSILSDARRLCRSRWWWRRLRGVHLLDVLAVDDPLALEMVEDPHHVVRAAVAEWLGDRHARPRDVQALLDLLDDPAPLVRFTAADALLRVGWRAVPSVTARLSDAGRTVTDPLMDVVAGLGSPEFSVPALARLTEMEPDGRRLLARYLGRVGGPDAGPALLGLLDDEAPNVRAEAARSLGLLGLWRVAPTLGRRLSDAEWSVRREAALALHSLGGPGALVLRRSAAGEEAFARDMALQIMDLPPSVGRRG